MAGERGEGGAANRRQRSAAADIMSREGWSPPPVCRASLPRRARPLRPRLAPHRPWQYLPLASSRTEPRRSELSQGGRRGSPRRPLGQLPTAPRTGPRSTGQARLDIGRSLLGGLHAGAHRINPTGRFPSRLALIRGKGHDQPHSVWPKPATTFVALSAVGPPQTSQRASSEHLARTSFRND